MQCPYNNNDTRININVMQNNEVHNNQQLIANATHNTITMHAGVTESKFRKALVLSLPLQSLLAYRLGCLGAVGPHTQHQACCR